MSMRITNTMMSTNTMRNINNAALRLNKANEQQSSQQKIQLPSDDPVIAGKSITYRNYVSTIEQYQSNVDTVSSWQQTTSDALSQLSDVVQNMRELTVQASSDTLTADEEADISTQLESLRGEMVQIMNTSYGGRYVFGGYKTTEEPYALESTSVGDVITFKGQTLTHVAAADITAATVTSYYSSNTTYEDSPDQNITINVGFDTEVTMNIEGQDVTGSGAGNLFDTVNKLILATSGQTSWQTVDTSTTPPTVSTESIDTIDDLLDDLDTNYNQILTTQAVLGARMNTVNRISDRLDNDYTNYTTLMSNNEDIDTAEASTNVTTADYVYQASLTVGAKVITKTLIDYIA